MDSMPDWLVWPLAALLAAVFLLYFWHSFASIIATLRRLVDLVQNWPQVRRRMAEAEAASGGRAPFWLRTVRVLLIFAMIGLVILIVWRKFAT